MKGNFPNNGMYPAYPYGYYPYGYYYPYPPQYPNQEGQDQDNDKKLLNPSKAMQKMKKKIVTTQEEIKENEAQPEKNESSISFNALVKKKYKAFLWILIFKKELTEMKKLAGLKSQIIAPQEDSKKPLPKKAVAIVKNEGESVFFLLKKII